MSQTPTAYRLSALGIVAIRGPDARRFLQGQLSCDVIGAPVGRVVFGGLHNPQGRVIALLQLAVAGDSELLAVLPRERAAVITARLQRFVLRAKVTLTDESARYSIDGFSGAAAATALLACGLDVSSMLPGDLRSATSGRVLHTGTVAAPRYLLLRLADATDARSTLPASISIGEAQIWHLDDIARGLPQVYAESSEAFVAQMLNLDVLGAIAFDKGCYTGQEVIARAHYRGRVKRRMRRFSTQDRRTLVPGQRIRLQDGRSAQIVDFAATAATAATPANAAVAGTRELLAVVAPTATLDDDAGVPSAPRAVATEPDWAVTELPLPYALP